MPKNNNHYVPQSYLKQWEKLNGRLWMYNKDNSLDRRSNTQKIMNENKLYIKTIDDVLSMNEDEINTIFGELQNYKISYNDNILTTNKEFSQYFNKWDNWQISINESSITTSEKNKLYTKIKQNRINTIEDNWHTVEDDWGKLVTKIEKTINNEITLNEEDFVLLKDFIYYQYMRTPKSKKYIQISNNIVFDSLLENDNSYGKEILKLKEKFERNLFLSMQNKIQMKSAEPAYGKLHDLFQNFSIIFYYTSSLKCLLTNDNPAFTILDNQKFYYGKRNGLYIAITPKILCGLYKGNKMQYRISQLSDKNVRIYNQVIRSETHEYYISCKEL